ncbi:hypothetical protein ACJIZ3_014583 [Penstemon smallii]|uniref:Uncharacterized protein n=1 Tax=Penstemon smallii TaxID=265156 RepID=A0ABD3RUI2_9LAMI
MSAADPPPGKVSSSQNSFFFIISGCTEGKKERLEFGTRGHILRHKFIIIFFTFAAKLLSARQRLHFSHRQTYKITFCKPIFKNNIRNKSRAELSLVV